jgi:hypothetical protein
VGRPTTKAELAAAADTEFDRLWEAPEPATCWIVHTPLLVCMAPATRTGFTTSCSAVQASSHSTPVGGICV